MLHFEILIKKKENPWLKKHAHYILKYREIFLIYSQTRGIRIASTEEVTCKVKSINCNFS